MLGQISLLFIQLPIWIMVFISVGLFQYNQEQNIALSALK